MDQSCSAERRGATSPTLLPAIYSRSHFRLLPNDSSCRAPPCPPRCRAGRARRVRRAIEKEKDRPRSRLGRGAGAAARASRLADDRHGAHAHQSALRTRAAVDLEVSDRRRHRQTTRAAPDAPRRRGGWCDYCPSGHRLRALTGREHCGAARDYGDAEARPGARTASSRLLLRLDEDRGPHLADHERRGRRPQHCRDGVDSAHRKLAHRGARSRHPLLAELASHRAHDSRARSIRRHDGRGVSTPAAAVSRAQCHQCRGHGSSRGERRRRAAGEGLCRRASRAARLCARRA